MHYLTVQDLQWINVQTTKTVNKFDCARLEEATYYQYAYGSSKSLTAQAKRFLTGFIKKGPFEAGNRATAFVAFVAFVRLNDAKFDVAAANIDTWLTRVIDHPEVIESAILATHDHGHEQTPRAVIQQILADYAEIIVKLDPLRI